mmetsp:Transcript_5229/g.11356  ORF Transcript_5229/g.11356 Transcript_5229/m.11356 type:complete len:573 (+) Transcript_5229:247-1965(+)
MPGTDCREQAGAWDMEEANRLRRLFASGQLVHPYLTAAYFSDDSERTCTCMAKSSTNNFTDLSAALAICCGASIPSSNGADLAKDIGGKNLDRRHIIFVLCDGMGNSVIDQHCGQAETSFLLRHNNPARLRAVFPSTTPAALTTLATAAWPASGHGMPGWDLRDKSGCDFPDCPAEKHGGGPPVHLRVLAEKIVDVRSGRPAQEMGFSNHDWDDVFVETPWAKQVANLDASKSRRMTYINAYNGSDFPLWFQGQQRKPSRREEEERKERTCSLDGGSDFSSWQMGRPRGPSLGDEVAPPNSSNASKWFEASKIQETAFDTLGQPEGSRDAISFFREGVDAALDAIAKAEEQNMSTFTYLYTAHPDKHMHSLGVQHEEVGKVVRGLDKEIARLWDELGSHETVLGRIQKPDRAKSENGSKEIVNNMRLDCSLVVSADHGHVTVKPQEMIQLPTNIVECLEYANVGVWGKGRHAYLHCRAGLQSILRERWRRAADGLAEKLILLSIEEAAELRLFGPDPIRMSVRPRLGDFVAIAVGNHTLVSPGEAEKYHHSQGAHGSLLPEEMCIPFVLCQP